MKTNVFLLLFSVSAFIANAQGFQGDTISGCDKNPLYMYGDWPGSIYVGDTSTVSVGMPIGAGEKEVAQRFYSKDKTIVYGVACGMAFAADTHFSEVYSQYQAGWYNSIISSINQFYQCDSLFSPVRQEYARLYSPDGGSGLQVIAQAPFYPNKDIADLWMAFHEKYLTYPATRSQNYAYRTVFFPIQEVYFETPCIVSDTFYAGATECDTIGYWPIKVVCLERPRASSSSFCQNTFARRNMHYHWSIGSGTGHLLIFPILGIDSTRRNDVELSAADRYTTISPNPTSDYTVVSAGCGMNKIEVFDNLGRKLDEMKTEGLTQRIDTRNYRSGIYVLHIHTPLGIAVKKLVVK